MSETHSIQVQVVTHYLAEQSQPENELHAFAYTITITNTGTVGAQLTHRHWLINHGNGRSEEVDGEGVVGEQPHLEPGQSYTYTSGAMIESAVGTMQGHYNFTADDGTTFEAPIEEFALSVPRTLH